MKEIHFKADDDIIKILETKKKSTKYPYTKIIIDSIKLAYDYDSLLSLIQDINKVLNSIYGKEFLIIDLIKQLYSDLEIENHTDYNKNQSLKQFFDDRRTNKDE